MKVVFAFLLVALAVAHALVPRTIEIPQDKLFPKKTLAEWQEILKNIKYQPSNAPKTKGFPQPASAGKTLTPRIIGGEDAQLGQFPWQTAVHMDSSYFCGGSIISETWILTAGHCVDGINSFTLFVGTISPYSGQSQNSRTSILHSSYDPYNILNDIGLIRLSAPLSLSATVNPVKLPSSSIGDLVGEVARISGWGRTSDNSGISPNLKWVDLPIIDGEVCAQVYGRFPSSQICASGENHRSTCNGDSGGPLVIQGPDGLWSEVGIVSYGSSYGCESGYPLGFTRVSSFLPWISSNTGLSL